MGLFWRLSFIHSTDWLAMYQAGLELAAPSAPAFHMQAGPSPSYVSKRGTCTHTRPEVLGIHASAGEKLFAVLLAGFPLKGPHPIFYTLRSLCSSL